MTHDTKEKVQIERIEDMLIQDILEASDDEILAEFAEECDNPEQEIQRMEELTKQAVFNHNKTKFEAAKRARLEQKAQPQKELQVVSLEQKKEIIKSLNANDNLEKKITMAARNEDELSENDLDVYLKHLIKLGIIDDKGNILCEDD